LQERLESAQRFRADMMFDPFGVDGGDIGVYADRSQETDD
jgi:hypothetical protein